MTKHRITCKLAVVILLVCFFYSFGVTNPFGPLFPDLAKIKALIQAQRQPASPARSAGLAKRLAPGTGSISGKVTDPNPTSYATSGVIVIDTFGYQVGRENCDRGGLYTVSGLYPGTYLVMASANGIPYLDGIDRFTYFGNTRDLKYAQWLHLSAGQSITGKDVFIQPEPKVAKGIVISGKAFAGSGTVSLDINTPISFKFASADPVDGATYYQVQTASASMKKDGSFTCSTSVLPGKYYVKMYTWDTKIAPQWWDGSGILSEPAAVTLPEVVTGKEVHFVTGGTLSGTVKDGSYDSLNDDLNVFLIDKDGFVFDQKYCNKRFMDFSFRGVPPGDYFLKACALSGVYFDSYYPQVSTRDSATAITIAVESAVTDRVLNLRRNPACSPAGSLTGQITGKITRADNGTALGEIGVLVSPVSGSSSFSTTTDTSGNYSAGVSGDSSYLVIACPSMYANGGGNDYYLAQTWYPGTTDGAAATPVKVGSGQSQPINIAVQQGGSIAGWLRTGAGNPLPISIWPNYYSNVVFGFAWDADFKNFSTTILTDLSGFRFPGMNPGTYTIRFVPMNFNMRDGTLSKNEFGSATARAISVTKENTAFQQALVAPDVSACITGTAALEPQVNRSSSKDMIARDMIYCYSADSIFTGNTFLMQTPGSASAKALFYSYDYTPLASKPQQADYVVGKLPPGKYALAHLTLDGITDKVLRTWCGGTGTVETVSLSDKSIFSRELFKPNIPSTAWITLAAGETKSGVNFGNVGAVNPLLSGNTLTPELRIVRGVSKKIAFRYRLPMRDKNSPGSLTIYRLDGARVKTIRLAAAEGLIVWDGKNDLNESASSGVYVFRLTGAGRAVTVKGAWVR
jgi:hypothetical protein